MKYRGAKKFILHKLKTELPPELTYHCYAHTLDVFNAARELCRAENIGRYETRLVKTAALFHDAGFIRGAQDHELKSCDIAREHLPRFDFSNAEIDRICGMIMATRIPQNPQNKLEEILCDADLDYLGREDFYTIGKTLFAEFKTFGFVQNEREWNEVQIRFLSAHQYFTPTNIARRKPKKEKYLAELKRMSKSPKYL
ncbi:MAG: HD domain-containing protein [Bacteroidetes bacterium]|nr:MAG: HD domain-containing protein [Bacteroidota bacterium]